MPIDLNPADPDYATDAQKRDIHDGMRRAAPAALTASTLLTRAAHANLPIVVNSATAVNIDVPAVGDCVDGDTFEVYNIGAGAVTLRTSVGGALTGNAGLPATLDQYSVGVVKRLNGALVRWA